MLRRLRLDIDSQNDCAMIIVMMASVAWVNTLTPYLPEVVIYIHVCMYVLFLLLCYPMIEVTACNRYLEGYEVEFVKFWSSL